ncbi:MAG: type II toxin-antitoxin system VapC family toxin [Terrimicrobiaceae bacterium]|nr:type II toxin-antitoxin system VapC family toxin [Terrimicrobiaceae bacterium]
MRFWDSSAIVPLLIEEVASAEIARLFGEDLERAVWWGTETECLSALTRRERESALSQSDLAAAETGLAAFLNGSFEIQPSLEVRRIARRLLMTHPLRAADSLQLAAALQLAGSEPGALVFISLDERLKLSARREGLRIVA